METDEIKLIESFAKLLRKKPFDTINGRDVTEAAELPPSRINYWFHDMYSLADALFREEEKTVVGAGISPESGFEAFLLSVSFALRERDAARNVCRSSAAGIYKKHVMTLSGKFFSEVVLKRSGDRKPGEAERSAVKFCRAAAVGLASKELLAADDPASEAEKYEKFFDAAIETINTAG